MSINQRIRELRKTLGLNQSDFGEKISSKKSAVSWMEQEGNTVTDQNIRLVCAAFNINEEWLRDGTGEMYQQPETDPLAILADAFGLSDESLALASAFFHLTDEQQRTIISFVEQAAADVAAARDSSEQLQDHLREVTQMVSEPPAGLSAEAAAIARIEREVAALKEEALGPSSPDSSSNPPAEPSAS